jgi:hypothetical protein
LQTVPLDIFELLRPTVPELRRSIDHTCFTVGVENLYLPFQFMWQPNIVRIQKPKVLTSGVANA